MHPHECDNLFQHIVSIIRRKWKSYASDWWNRLDWLSMAVYTCGMLLKLGEGSHVRNASKILLVAAFILLSIRIINLCCMSSILGPKLVMIRKMVCSSTLDKMFRPLAWNKYTIFHNPYNWL